MKTLILLCLPGPTPQEEMVRKFAVWMGVETRMLIVHTNSDIVVQLSEMMEANGIFATSAETLVALHDASGEPSRLHGFLKSKLSGVLIFGCDDSLGQSAALTWLSEGAVDRMTPAEENEPNTKTFVLPRSSGRFSRQLCGLEFSLDRAALRPAFDLNPNDSKTQAIMTAENRPVFVCANIGSCRVFLYAGAEVPDIDEPLSRQKGIEEKYDVIIPFLIFVRFCFLTESWHGTQSTARLIIDDPLLGDRYGLLEYRALLNSIVQEKYGTSIAFIPWNYRRTDKEWVGQFLKEKANLSICVHGCDHSNREFEDLDLAVVMHKSRLALERMEKHEQRTEMPYERVMVFPQGRFSKAAIRALRANNYLAAANTSCFPVDYAPNELTVGDFLRPAIMRFDGFPIFQRRYPKRLIDFAFDIFLGKPALIVEHHQYFGDGCKALEEFIRNLHTIEPTLSWPTLSDQLLQSCMVRYDTSDSVNVRFFTKRFQMRDTHEEKRHFLLEKDEPDPTVVRSVLVDRQPVPFEIKDGLIQFEVEADPGQIREIEIEDYPQSSPQLKNPGVTYSIGVYFRRGLSEFRDNTLSRYPSLLEGAKKVAKSLKVTGDRGRRIDTVDPRNRHEKVETDDPPPASPDI